MPEFVQDAIESLQNGQLPAIPMDTQPFVNSSIDTSTSSSDTTTSTMPSGGVVRIEHSMSMEVHGQGGIPTGGPIYLPKTACLPRQTVTSTVTVTKACSTAITRTKTKVNTVVKISTTTVTASEDDTTTTSEKLAAPSPPPPPPPPVPKPSTSQPPPAPPIQKPTFVTSSSKSTSLAPPSSISTKPPAPPPSSAPAAPPPTGPAPAAGFHTEVFASHNDWRAKYGAKALVWDADLASKADAWSKQCQFVHQEGFSSNLDSSGSTDGKPQLSGEAVLEHWVNGPNEKDSWDPNNPAGSHFTQVVWKGASKVGCAKFECNLSNYDAKFWPNAYAVCYYDIGNVAGQYT